MNNNAQQSLDDERLARQLQEAELAQAGGGGFPGAAPGGGQVVRGIAVSGPGGPGGPPGGGGFVPGQAMPMTYGAPMGQPIGGQQFTVVVEPDLPREEQQVLAYRFSLKCFAGIDAVSTVLNTVSVIMAARNGEDGEERPGIMGYRGVLPEQDSALGFTILAVTGLAFLVGPICGYVGAQRLNRGLVLVYLGFCIMKAVFEATLAILSPHFWLIILALVQVWVSKIVFTFWRALGLVSAARLEELKRPDFLMNQPTRVLYW